MLLASKARGSFQQGLALNLAAGQIKKVAYLTLQMKAYADGIFSSSKFYHSAIAYLCQCNKQNALNSMH